mmetsp:Transcript_58720/g.96971  ORF Transcript_58720/g.96971 Transcript_58720/m.96971 type:complete len:99 (-) Transcript_58720:741-1037(-)
MCSRAHVLLVSEPARYYYNSTTTNYYCYYCYCNYYYSGSDITRVQSSKGPRVDVLDEATPVRKPQSPRADSSIFLENERKPSLHCCRVLLQCSFNLDF